MAAEGTLCGFIYLEGSAQPGLEDSEPSAPSMLGIPDGPGKWESGLRVGALGSGTVGGLARTWPRPSHQTPPLGLNTWLS